MNLRCEIQKNVGEQANGAFRNRNDVSSDGQQTDVVSSRTDESVEMVKQESVWTVDQ